MVKNTQNEKHSTTVCSEIYALWRKKQAYSFHSFIFIAFVQETQWEYKHQVNNRFNLISFGVKNTFDKTRRERKSRPMRRSKISFDRMSSIRNYLFNQSEDSEPNDEYSHKPMVINKSYNQVRLHFREVLLFLFLLCKHVCGCGCVCMLRLSVIVVVILCGVECKRM